MEGSNECFTLTKYYNLFAMEFSKKNQVIRKQRLSSKWSVHAYSKSGISTIIWLKDLQRKNVSILFDCGGLGGVNPAVLQQSDNVFISHCHIDHFGGIFAHARSRFASDKKNRAKYYVPKSSLGILLEAKKCFEVLDDHSELNMELIGVAPGDVIELGNQLSCECVANEHRVPSMGFLLVRNTKRLKPEYVHLSGEEKGILGKSGVLLEETFPVIEVSYSGDTTAKGIDSRLFQAELCIVECTFIDEADYGLAVDTKHVTLKDLTEVMPTISKDCQLLLVHFSARYSFEFITRVVRENATFKKLSRPPGMALAAFTPVGDEGEAMSDFGIFY